MKKYLLLAVMMLTQLSMLKAQKVVPAQSDTLPGNFDTTYIFEYFMLQDRAYFRLGDVTNYIDSMIVVPENVQRTVVMVDFVIEPNDSFSQVRAYTPNERFPLIASHKKAALDVVNSMEGKWEPARIGEVKVRMRMTLPVSFRPKEH